MPFCRLERVASRSLRRLVVAAITVLVGLVPIGAPSCLQAQQWRDDAAHLGTTTRVLLVGTRPEDEDNALIAWLRGGRHVETAFLSLTRGEAGRNVAGAERNAPLAVVRTAELLAERQRDGAHQFFTRAFDLGNSNSDSLAARAWPRDSLLIDMVSIIRAFRPQVVIALVSADSETDAARRYTARLLAIAYKVAADTSILQPRTTGRLPAWPVSRLFTLVTSAGDTANGSRARLVRINIGEYDRSAKQTYAELGAELRRLQRTQGVGPVPALGEMQRVLRLDSARVGGDGSLLGTLDTTFARHRAIVKPEFLAGFDSLRAAIAGLTKESARLPADTLAARLAAVARLSIANRLELDCPDLSGVPSCDGGAGDLAVALNTLRERATALMMDAAGIVIDANAEREMVAAGDSVSVALTVFNGGGLPIGLRRLASSVQGRLSIVFADSMVMLQPGSTTRFTTQLRFLSPSYHWWQINGLVEGTLLQKHPITRGNSVASQLVMGEDRIAASRLEATMSLAGVEVPVIVQPIVTRTATMLRGDARRPVFGVPETSLLFERGAEYERAGMTVDRLFRVYVSNARSTADTVAVSLQLPVGLVADSVSKTVPLPPFSARNVFFRLRGAVPMGTHAIAASARSVAALPVLPAGALAAAQREFTLGAVVNEYPHIPSQHFVRFARDRVESVNLRFPARFRVAYIRGTEDLRPAFQQLRLSVQSLDLALVPVADLTNVTAVLIGAGALRSESSLLAVPALRAFMQRGGVVVVLPGGAELSRIPLFPFGVAMREAAGGEEARGAEFQLADPGSPLFTRPNIVTATDLESWGGDRNCSLSSMIYQGWKIPLVAADDSRRSVQPSVLIAPVGKGTIMVTSLCLAQQLEGAQAGAAKLLVNMLSYPRAVP